MNILPQAHEMAAKRIKLMCKKYEIDALKLVDCIADRLHKLADSEIEEGVQTFRFELPAICGQFAVGKLREAGYDVELIDEEEIIVAWRSKFLTKPSANEFHTFLVKNHCD